MSVVLNAFDPYHLVYAGQGSGVIANRDLTNTVLLGPDQGTVTRGGPEVSVLDPLGAIPVNGEVDIWAIVDNSQAAPGSYPEAEIDFIPSATSWSPAASAIGQVIAPLAVAIAQQIFATGIPIVPDPTVLYNL